MVARFAIITFDNAGNPYERTKLVDAVLDVEQTLVCQGRNSSIQASGPLYSHPEVDAAALVTE